MMDEQGKLKLYNLPCIDILLEEACRQWCCMIDKAPERVNGEGFANFFYEIVEDKIDEYMKRADSGT